MDAGGGPIAHPAHGKKPEPKIPAPAAVPDFAHLLPEPIRPFMRSIEDANSARSFREAGMAAHTRTC